MVNKCLSSLLMVSMMAACVGVAPPQSPSRHRPYVASLKRSVYNVQPDGTEILRAVRTSLQARDRQGRVYQTSDSLDAKPVRFATLFDEGIG